VKQCGLRVAGRHREAFGLAHSRNQQGRLIGPQSAWILVATLQYEVAGACQLARETALCGFVQQACAALAHGIECREQCGAGHASGKHPFLQQSFRLVHAQHKLTPIHVDVVVRATERGFQ
jgi:hypothetical protein